MPQLVGRSFQQQPPPHGCRSFFDRGSEQPVELRATLVRLPRQILRLRVGVQGVRNQCREAVPRALTIRFIHGSSTERIIDKDEKFRLIVRTDLSP